MPVHAAKQVVTDTARLMRHAVGRVSTEKAETPAELAGNRLVSGASTIALGGSIAAIVTYFLQPPETLHAHVVAIVIWGWQSVVFGVSKWNGR